MEKVIQEKLENAGVDLPVVLERFLNNEDLLLQFLKKFSSDNNYQLFRDAMEQKDFEEAFKAVHNLKGLCGNLSITPLYEAVCVEVEFLRNNKHEEALEYVPEVVERYNKAVEILSSL